MLLAEIDGFVAVQNVRVIGSTAQTVHCRIGDRNVWLPRMHVVGRLTTTGNQRRLLVRRWVACDRHLIDVGGVATAATRVPSPRHHPGVQLHLVRSEPHATPGRT